MFILSQYLSPIHLVLQNLECVNKNSFIVLDFKTYLVYMCEDQGLSVPIYMHVPAVCPGLTVQNSLPQTRNPSSPDYTVRTHK